MRKNLICCILLGLICCGKPLPQLPGISPSIRNDRVIHLPLPEGALAFNAAMVRYNGQLIMCFRLERAHRASSLGVVMLTDNFAPQGPISEIEPESGAEDPRLIVHNGALLVLFNRNVPRQQTRRMQLAQLLPPNPQTSHFTVKWVKQLEWADHMRTIEKNWTPFVQGGQLHFIYQSNPPVVLSAHEAQLSNNEPTLQVDLNVKHTDEVMWGYGEIRGGTPAVYDEELNSFVSVFHSSTDAMTAKREGKYYVMGLYTFSATPPYAIEQVAPLPMVGPNFYAYPPLKQNIVFPQGMLIEGNLIHVSYGKDDNAIGVSTFHRSSLISSLKPAQR